MTIERTILSNLLFNEPFTRKVSPFLKKEYFHDRIEGVMFEEISRFVEHYHDKPSKDSLTIAIGARNDLSGDDYQSIMASITDLSEEKVNQDWLVDLTEKFCKDKAVYNAIFKGIQIIDGNDDKYTQDAIPEILSEALSVGFDNHVGHDYKEDAGERYEFYHKSESKIPFDLNMFNKITKGGLSNKTLNIVLAGTGAGKSLFMCHMAAANISQGRNVLYMTLEMAEEMIAERIDANLMNVNIGDLVDLPKKMFTDKINKIKEKANGQLVIKEYPTSTAHAGHFRSLLKELAIKKDFTPDIIYIDYINICASSRLRSDAGSYFYVKAIAEELRGLAVENNLPIVSATQTTRGGYDNTDISLTDTSESFGLPATSDLMVAIIATEEMDSLNQVMVKQLKNRYNDISSHKRFILGIDKPKMRLYDVEQSAQDELVYNKPAVTNFDDFKM